MVAFLVAAGDLVSYAREDEHLQLSSGTFQSPEDLSAQALGTTISQVRPFVFAHISAMQIKRRKRLVHVQTLCLTVQCIHFWW